MKPLSDFAPEAVQGLIGVFTDIDDTLTSAGRLPAVSYAALEQLDAAGFAVVPVTGRPAGWCDMVARFWPVAGVIGENGAFYFRYDHDAHRMQRCYFASPEERRSNRTRLEALSRRILDAVPGAALSADQFYREADLAVDFREDVEPLPRAEIERIVALFEEAGAVAKISSIHVNGWFGRYDKLTMAKRFAAEVLGLDLDRMRAHFAYCGDSPNDAPMFGFFPNAFGVANVHDFAGRMPSEPAFIAPSRGAQGFAEIAQKLLACPRARPLPHDVSSKGGSAPWLR